MTYVRLAFLLLTFILGLYPGVVQAADYKLGPQDKLRVRIVEWRAGKSESHEWSTINGEFTIDPSGKLSLPLIGELKAQGSTLTELALSVSEALKSRVTSLNTPVTSIEVVQFRPFYIVGAVERPGEYAYRPGMTVLQAVGLAGGHYRPTEAGLMRLERERIIATGSLETARLEMRRLVTRRARLRAELLGANAIDSPTELRNEPDAARLIADEHSIMTARTEGLRSQLAAIAELKGLLVREIASLDQKILTQERQINLARREMRNISTLAEKGLTVNARELSIERTVAELEGKMLDLESAKLRAQQELSKAERNALDLTTERKAKLVGEMQEVQSSIDQAAAKIDTAASLINDSLVTAPRLAFEQSAATTGAPIYRIVRSQSSGRPAEMDSDELTSIEPGDVVRVEIAGHGTGVEARGRVSETALPPKALETHTVRSNGDIGSRKSGTALR